MMAPLVLCHWYFQVHIRDFRLASLCRAQLSWKGHFLGVYCGFLVVWAPQSPQHMSLPLCTHLVSFSYPRDRTITVVPLVFEVHIHYSQLVGLVSASLA